MLSISRNFINEFNSPFTEIEKKGKEGEKTESIPIEIQSSVLSKRTDTDIFIRDPIIILLLRIICTPILLLRFIYFCSENIIAKSVLSSILFFCFNRIYVMCFVPCCCFFVSFATASCKFLFHFTGKTFEINVSI